MSNDNHSKRATEDALDELHGLVAQAFIDQIRAGGEAITPALLAQAAKFLKDNGVDRPRRPGNATDKLAKELEKFEEEFGGNVVGFPK